MDQVGSWPLGDWDVKTRRFPWLLYFQYDLLIPTGHPLLFAPENLSVVRGKRSVWGRRTTNRRNKQRHSERVEKHWDDVGTRDYDQSGSVVEDGFRSEGKSHLSTPTGPSSPNYVGSFRCSSPGRWGPRLRVKWSVLLLKSMWTSNWRFRVRVLGTVWLWVDPPTRFLAKKDSVGSLIYHPS